jgi:drug/metabolite transporter (DMT)-like permease
MGSHLIGETAAVVTAALWTSCSILFASAGKRIGPLSVNAYRIAMATGLLGVTHLVLFRTIVPPADGSQWFFLGISGVAGLALGDFGYFGALVFLGPRRGVLLMSMAPIFSVISGYFILGEVLSLWNLVGIIVTLSGVTWVILEKDIHTHEPSIPARQKTYGILSGLGGAVGQGLGLVISKYGMLAAGGEAAGRLNTLSSTLIRMIVAAAFVWLLVGVSGKLPQVFKARHDGKAMVRTFAGAVTGPFIGVWLSMVAVTYAIAGVAATLMSLMPVMVIPILWVLYRQKTSLRGIAGAAVAVVGVAILFGVRS